MRSFVILLVLCASVSGDNDFDLFGIGNDIKEFIGDSKDQIVDKFHDVTNNIKQELLDDVEEVKKMIPNDSLQLQPATLMFWCLLVLLFSTLV